jgi:hypothetical protein
VCYRMRQLLILTILTINFLSCRSKNETSIATSSFQLLIPDTTNNKFAQWDYRDIKYRSKLENQLGLRDIKRGVDSLEVRLWYSFSFTDILELYVLRFQDTSCLVSYFRVYARQFKYDEEGSDRNWNPYIEPIIDSSVSKSVLLSKEKYKNLHIDSIWFLKSQSEVKIPDSVGFTDGDSYTLEIADKKRFKYLRHHCAMSYYEKTKLPEIQTFIDFCGRITNLADKFGAMVPYTYD